MVGAFLEESDGSFANGKRKSCLTEAKLLSGIMANTQVRRVI